MANTYTTHNVLLGSADFHVLITEFPEEDVNDRLALLAQEGGLIYKHLYEDFVLTTCMANSGPFFFHIRRRPELLTRFADIRKEALSLAFKYSPGFKPENIVINENNVLKTIGSLKLGESGRPLTSNDLWNQDPPLSHFGGSGIIINTPTRDGNPISGIEGDEEDTNFKGPDVPVDNPFVNNSGNFPNSNLPYTLVGHKWDTPGIHINIRQYEDDVETLINLLGDTPFKSVRGYHLLIVELCVEDFSDVFHLLDKMGISSKYKPEKLVAELYEIVLLYNPFLKLEEINLGEIRQEYKRRLSLRHHRRLDNRRTVAAGAEEKGARKKGIRFSDLTNEKLLRLASDMKEKIVGQDEAVEHIADAIHRASVGLKRKHEPIGVLLFTGNTGVGKTETAKVLADVLGAHLTRIDCQEYQQPHEVAKLTGSPPGYVGYDDGGHLTREIAKYPFSVVLFDEIEKAHSNFHERLLQIIDEGFLTESKGGKKIPFDQTIIIMTSNIGVKEVESISRTLGFGDVASKTEDKTAFAREEALKRKFKPEFLNRIDEIVHFHVLGKNEFMHILEILLKEVQDQLDEGRNLKLQINAGAKNFLLDKGIDKKFGARPLRRAVKKYLSTPLSLSILKKKIPSEKSKIIVSLKPSKDGLSFREARVKKEEDGND